MNPRIKAASSEIKPSEKNPQFANNNLSLQVIITFLSAFLLCYIIMFYGSRVLMTVLSGMLLIISGYSLIRNVLSSQGITKPEDNQSELIHNYHPNKASQEIIKQNQELELRVAERTTELLAYTKELEAFSYSVSHDLMAPLRAINGFTSAIQEDCATMIDDTGKEYLDRISQNVTRMSMLIDDLLSLSLITRAITHYEQVNISEMAKDIAADFEGKTNARFIIHPGIMAFGDSGLIRIAMENLISNAVKYTSLEEQAEIQIEETHLNNKTYILVKDNGVGFEMTYADKLFTPFQRLHSEKEFKGNGIGLALVQRIIMKHGGEIQVQSSPGKGAHFFLRFATVSSQEFITAS